jgi:hypothetical protein
MRELDEEQRRGQPVTWRLLYGNAEVCRGSSPDPGHGRAVGVVVKVALRAPFPLLRSVTAPPSGAGWL